MACRQTGDKYMLMTWRHQVMSSRDIDYMWDKQILVFQEEGFQIPVPS